MGVKFTRLIQQQREMEQRESLEGATAKSPPVLLYDVEWAESKDVIRALKGESELTAMPWVHLYGAGGERRHSFACGSLKMQLLEERLAQVRGEGLGLRLSVGA
jgi:hypothetical protein